MYIEETRTSQLVELSAQTRGDIQVKIIHITVQLTRARIEKIINAACELSRSGTSKTVRYGAPNRPSGVHAHAYFTIILRVR